MMKHNSSIPFMLAFVCLISLVIIGIGIKQKKRADIIIGAFLTVLCLVAYYFLEFLN